MKKLVITGGNKLQGSVQISGAKNAALPLMVASILTNQKLTLSNIPQVADISTMANLLSNLGIEITLEGGDEDGGHLGKVLSFSAATIDNPVAPYELVCKMRASILILGPLLARFGKAKVSLPGGCAIGTRPVDLHLKAIEKMGAKIELIGGYIEASVEGKLKGAVIHFSNTSDDGSKCPYDRNKARHHDGFGSVLLKKRVSLIDVSRVKEFALRPVKQTRSDLASKEVTDLVTDDGCSKSDEGNDG